MDSKALTRRGTWSTSPKFSLPRFSHGVYLEVMDETNVLQNLDTELINGPAAIKPPIYHIGTIMPRVGS
jgi:hypothetical protein